MPSASFGDATPAAITEGCLAREGGVRSIANESGAAGPADSGQYDITLQLVAT